MNWSTLSINDVGFLLFTCNVLGNNITYSNLIDIQANKRSINHINDELDEFNGELSNKADKVHIHEISDIYIYMNYIMH